MRLLLLTLTLTATAHVSAQEPHNIQLSGTPGPYTLEQWRQDWPGCKFEGGIREGRVQLHTGPDAAPWLRVNHAPGKIGPDEGGAGWRMPLPAPQTSAELRYTLRFSPGFEFVKGGKLPGLCGGPENVSGGRPADGRNGFSARLMWRRDGRGEAYLYHMDQPEKYGESLPFPADFRFPTGQPVEVRLALTLNHPGEKNGGIRVWITLPGQPERLVAQRAGLRWRAVDSILVDSIYFETFHGGGDTTWAPTAPCWTEFTRIRVIPAATP